MDKPVDTLTQLRQLQEQFKGALAFLSKTRLAKQQALSKLPWYILLGPSQAGKTSLLAHSKQEFILAKKAHRLNIHATTSTQVCDWWATKEAVYADLSGRFTDELLCKQSAYPSLWQETIHLLNEYYQQNPNLGVILVLSTHTLKGDKATLLNTAKLIKEQLQNLHDGFKQSFPIYLIINQLDRLNGFNDFFYDLSQEERAQPCGFNCQNLNTHNKKTLTQWLDKPFEQLLTRLNSQLLFHLQRQNQLSKRLEIYNFPMEMANLKPSLLFFLEQTLTITSNLAWHSIHFTSSAAQIHNSAHQVLSLPINAPAHTPRYSIKAYFVDNLLQHLTHKQLQLQLNNQLHTKRWLARLSYVFVGTVIVASITVWAYSFNQQISTTRHIEKALTEFQTLAHPHSSRTLTANIELLDTLKQGTILPQHWFIPTKIKQLQTSTAQTYQLALQELLLPQLTAIFSQQLVNPTALEPLQLYAVLQAYLMLADQQHSQPTFVVSKLIDYWRQNPDYNPALLPHLQEHLNALLTLTPTLKLDQTLVATARLRLTQLKPLTRAYAILNNLQWFAPTVLYTDPQQTMHAIEISSFYTKNTLAKVYQQQLVEACQQAQLGNWVLGNLVSAETVDPLTLETLKSQLSDLYLSDYAHAWQRVIAELAELNLGKPEDIINTLDQLLNRQSKLQQALATINQNTRISSATQGYSIELANKLNTKFSTLAEVVETKDAWQNLQTKLRQLQVYLLQMKLNDNHGESAYIAAKTRILAPNIPQPISEINNFAEQLPNPWQAWLLKVNTNSWQYILNHATHYLEQIWQEKVWDFYQHNIAEHFPFSPATTATAVSLANFDQFFSPQGILDHYFITYLQPFIDTSLVNWQPKIVDGQSLALSKNSLSALQQAAIIQRMFYPQQQTKPMIKFSLAPLAIDARAQKLQLIIHNKRLDYPSDKAQSIELTWPATNQDDQIKLIYEDKEHKYLIADFKGPWALFHFLQKGTLIATTDPKLSLVAFNAGDSLLQFELYAYDPINPFRQDLLTKFKLPENIATTNRAD